MARTFPKKIYGPIALHSLALQNGGTLLLIADHHHYNAGQPGEGAVYVADFLESAAWIDEIWIEASTIVDAGILKRTTSADACPLIATIHRGVFLTEAPHDPAPLAARIRFADVRRAGIFWLLSAIEEPGLFMTLFEQMFPDIKERIMRRQTNPGGPRSRGTIAYRFLKGIEGGFFRALRKKDSGMAFLKSLVMPGMAYPAWLQAAIEEAAGYGILMYNPVHDVVERMDAAMRERFWEAVAESWHFLLDARNRSAAIDDVLETQARSTSRQVLERYPDDKGLMSYVVRILSLVMDAFVVGSILTEPPKERALVAGGNHTGSIARILVRLGWVMDTPGTYSVMTDNASLDMENRTSISLAWELGSPGQMLSRFRHSFARRHGLAEVSKK